jgi:hypothetical protein
MYQLRSINHEHHTKPLCSSGLAAIRLARERGFEVAIEYLPVDGSESILAASWSPLYGTKIISEQHWNP